MADNKTGELVKQHRERLGLTQEELAEKIGYKHKTSINKIELGEAGIPRQKIPRFAQVLGLSPAEVAGWSEEHIESSFSYCLEQQMRILGYTVEYSGEGDVVMHAPEADYEITGADIKELEKRLALYLRFALQEITERSRRF